MRSGFRVGLLKVTSEDGESKRSRSESKKLHRSKEKNLCKCFKDSGSICNRPRLIEIGEDLRGSLPYLCREAIKKNRNIIFIVDLANVLNRFEEFKVDQRVALIQLISELSEVAGECGEIRIVFNYSNSHLKGLSKVKDILECYHNNKDSVVEVVGFNNSDEVDMVDETIIYMLKNESSKGNLVFIVSNDSLGKIKVNGERALPYHNIRLASIHNKVLLLPHKLLRKTIADCVEYPPFTWPEWAIEALKKGVCEGKLGVKRSVVLINDEKRFYTTLDSRRSLRSLLREYGIVVDDIRVIRSNAPFYHILIAKGDKVFNISTGSSFELESTEIDDLFESLSDDVKDVSVVHPKDPQGLRELLGSQEGKLSGVRCLLVPASCSKEGTGWKCNDVSERVLKEVLEAFSRQFN